MSPARRALVTLGVILGMLMQLLDMTIAKVALPHMQASLGATQDQIDWVLTSYIVAAAIATPVTDWFADRLGRKAFFLSSVVQGDWARPHFRAFERRRIRDLRDE